MDKKLVPSFCCFGMVDTCMFRCQMCFKWKEDTAVKEYTQVSTDAWHRALISLKSIVPDPRALVINFGGGEVLLHADVLTVVKTARACGFTTNIASNGWLIDERMAERIAASGLHSINISLDSLEPETHDELRGMPGATDQVCRAIDSLRKYSKVLEIGVCSVIYERNYRELWRVVDWVQQNPAVNWILFMAAMQPNNTDVLDEWYQKQFAYLWPQNIWAVQWFLVKAMWRKWWGGKIQNPYYQLRAFQRYYAAPQRFVKRGACNMDRALHVSATGDIFLCFRHEKLGNIMHDDIATVWHSEKAERVREHIRACKENCHFLLNCYFEKEYPFSRV